MDNIEQEKAAPEARSAKGASAHSKDSGNKFAIARTAAKQRKKRAHRRTLRRSNTKG